MQVLWSVIKDLSYFVTVEKFGLTPQKPTQILLPEHNGASKLPTDPFVHQSTAVFEESNQETEDLLSPQFQADVSDRPTEIPVDTTFLYVAIPQTSLRMFPTYSIDDVLLELPYGARLQYHKRQGKWVSVEYQSQTGWVPMDAISVQEEKVFPALYAGEAYDATNSETIKLRTCIDDEFSAVAAEAPLQDIEYVWYRLQTDGRKVDWPMVRPRIAGTWQRHLKGLSGIHIGVHPKTDTVLEYIDEDEVGHIAYVDAVYPDHSIALSMIETDSAGLFHKGTYAESVWKEWRPVFKK